MNPNKWLQWSTVAATAVLVAGCASYPDEATTRQMAEKMVFDAFAASPAPIGTYLALCFPWHALPPFFWPV